MTAIVIRNRPFETHLQNNRKTNLFHKCDDFIGILHGSITSRHDRNTRSNRGRSGCCLVTKDIQVLDRGSHKGNAGSSTLFRKGWTLTQESISWMNRIDVGLLGNLDNLIHIQICGNWRCIWMLFQQKGLIGTPSMLGIAIFVTVNGHRSGIQFRGGSHDANGNLGTVGSHDISKDWKVTSFSGNKRRGINQAVICRGGFFSGNM
jgi:hypothetical protein